MNIPKLSDINLDLLGGTGYLPGARDKVGRSMRFTRMGKIIANENGYTMDNVLKWVMWYHYVGIYHDGIDALRNGVCIITQLQDFGWKNFDIDFQRQMAPLWTETFPVLVRKLVALNPPVIFSAVHKVFSTLIKRKILDRLEVMQTKDLGKLIEPDQLLAEFGGNVNYTSQDWVKNLREWAERCEERLTAPGRE